MSDEPIRFIDTDGQSEYVSPVKPLPVNIGSATLSVTADGVEIKNDTGNPVPMSVASLPLPSGAATASNQTTANTSLASIAGLTIPAHDYISLGYTGTNLTSVVYKAGGASGTTVATLTLAYSGSNLTSVTKS